MGDCRIRIVIAKDLIPNIENDFTMNQMYTSDTTVREVMESTKQLFSLYQSKQSFQLWDVTLSPPNDITCWPLEDFPELQGPKSKTLHSAGWFPSGSLLVLPPNVKPSEYKVAVYDDSQYNKQEALAPMETDSKPTIEFKDETLTNSQPLPSQVMESVVKRFANDPNEQDVSDAQTLRRQNQEARKALEEERATKLDQRIKKLEETSNEKNKKVSDQVRLMLIKSRATGVKSLKQRDRMYFECVADKNGELTKEYRFFSPQDTFAKIASSFSAPTQAGFQNNEVIIKRGDAYLRFPVSMRVYEAIADGHLSDKFNVIVIRWYSDNEDPSPSIVSKDDETEQMQMSQANGGDTNEARVGEAPMEQDSVNPISQSGVIEDIALGKLLQDLDITLSKGKKPKKNSAAAMKVRCMQIKSKAKGDAKRVPKMEDRFFLEVVTVSKAGEAKSSYCFLARKDKIERLLQVVATLPTSNLTELEFLVATEKASEFTAINDTSIELNGAEQRQLLKGFDRIILRQK
ncbi:unnamed protein product [Cylindrotheca closterium]|uniref:Uncharacterized protein n=1 Tax=Cylindrotheca closterium TaxID=2856 RepID=A0AAD2CB88_9STRA|nr:unnamed protein product [Cylindrotheca closterium]